MRWFHQDGTVVPTGDERADREKLEKEEAQRLAQSEKLEKEEAQRLAQLLAEKLRELGVDPDAIN
ncbi:hypothetical protein VB711_16770 [Cronbergia sp. UHCC 0137]|uniref:hypothetical protein n=1 Tax=Cronbergia sp. UHCC 0137 TaxID=3110239 RepID=UPI002B1F1DB0|nr:hypothetical protein [Cronbergia sp. UHCC 0137]MEA5619482.1 hypothetical protein [Cronbergia sp. UHCC 0137]